MIFTYVFVCLVAVGCGDGKNAQTLFREGNSKFDTNDWNGAIICYCRVIELNPNSSAAYANRATAERHLGRFDDALVDYSHSA